MYIKGLKNWLFYGICVLGPICANGDERSDFYKLKKLSEQADAVRGKEDPSGVLIAKDSSVGILPFTEELAKIGILTDWVNFDPGFQKWVLLFREIPGEAPFSIQLKRTSDANPNAFVTLKDVLSSETIAAMKKEIGLVSFVLSTKGFLPGEPITCRLASKDPNVYRDITFCPRPLILKKDSGEILLKATLLSHPYELTSYDLEICGVKKNEYFRFRSRSGQEVMRQLLKGPTIMNYMPGTLRAQGGIAYLEITCENNPPYKIALPWGSELLHYQSGTK